MVQFNVYKYNSHFISLVTIAPLAASVDVGFPFVGEVCMTHAD